MLWISGRCPVELHRQGSLTSGVRRSTNQWYFMKRKRRNERKRKWEEKGWVESKMNRCGRNAYLINLFSILSHSQCAALLYYKFSVLVRMWACLCVHTGQTGVCLTLTCVCVCIVLMCMMPFTLCTKWLRPTECSWGIYTLNHTVQHSTPRATESEAQRQAETQVIRRQAGSTAWESVPWQTLVATAPSWQNALERNKLDSEINVPPNHNSLVTLVKQL